MAMSQATHPKMELCIVLGTPDGNLGENLQRNLRMVFIQCDRAPEICDEGWKKQLVEVFCSCHHFQSFVDKVMSTEEEIRYFSTFFSQNKKTFSLHITPCLYWLILQHILWGGILLTCLQTQDKDISCLNK